MQIAPVHHRRITVDGIDTIYREAGPPDAPVLLVDDFLTRVHGC